MGLSNGLPIRPDAHSPLASPAGLSSHHPPSGLRVDQRKLTSAFHPLLPLEPPKKALGGGLPPPYSSHDFSRDALFQFRHCPDFMPAIRAINERMVGMVLVNAKAVPPALGTIEFDAHFDRNTLIVRFCFGCEHQARRPFDARILESC